MNTTTQPTIGTTAVNGQRALWALAGGILFQAIFWQEKMGINTVLFFAFIAGAIAVLYKNTLSLKNAWHFALATFVSLGAIVIENTLLSKLAFGVALLLLCLHATQSFRSLHYSIAALSQQVIKAIPGFVKDWIKLTRRTHAGKQKQHHYRLFVLPLMLALLFLGIYMLANYVLADIISHLGDSLATVFSKLFDWISFPRMFFMLWGVFICATLLVHRQSKLSNKEQLENDELIRHYGGRNKKQLHPFQQLLSGKSYHSAIALKLEYKGAVISLVLLNILLAVVNVSDIVYVWFNRTYKPGFEWVEFVHNGAEILVFSILLAIAVVLYFFRGNINFLKQNNTVKTVACLWIAQNFVLAISVAVRNYYYISHMGLAYKRIGLFVFVLMVMAGLATTYVKITQRKTIFFLLRINGWLLYSLFIACSLINWDVVIVKYNLAHKDQVPLDVPFMLELNAKTLPLLEQEKALLAKPQTTLQRHYYADYESGSLVGKLEWRKQQFKQEQADYSWLSWNYTDQSIKSYFGY